MPSTARRRAPAIDPTVYPVEEKVGEDLLQRFIVEMLRPLIAALFAKQGRKALVGADQFIYWEQHNPRKAVAPDVYVLPGLDPRTRVKAWKVWETGIAPSFALEVMSDDERKDVEQSPVRYAELGVKELVVFDPEPERRADGVRFRVYRKVGKRGLVLVEVTNEDRVRSKELGCWLRAVGEGVDLRLRVGLGPQGDELLWTEGERAEQERAAREQERAAREREAARAEQERAARLRAEQEVARLRAELDAIRR
jgi:Uma2 family endonuclease